ncbi:uncharacterized protein LOC128220230 [Mya arenaria]|uniref:uncharacterized protein LOC128220230 n=1 Tax=Mya arenaria TaxID=6604 RepID=UPI0022E4448D|nr:uncharacterized protein LOC128220230 [Mya arenaria]
MSKTFTSRPGVTRGRGRGNEFQPRPVNQPQEQEGAVQTGARPRVGATGRGSTGTAIGTGRGSFGRGSVGRGLTAPNETPGQTLQGVEQRMEYLGGFTKVTPNEKKRQQITQAAQKETQAYEAHKKQNTPQSFSYVGTAGGGQTTQTDARRKLVQTTPNKTQKMLQQQERKSLTKQHEEAEIEKKRAEQRAKAERNERRDQEERLNSEKRWDEQRKRKNDAFLRGLENKTKGSSVKAPASQSQTRLSAPQPPVSNSSLPEPEDALSEGAAWHIEEEDRLPGGATGEADLTIEERRRLDALNVMFPNCARDVLRSLLEQTDFSLDAAVALLHD